MRPPSWRWRAGAIALVVLAVVVVVVVEARDTGTSVPIAHGSFSGGSPADVATVWAVGDGATGSAEARSVARLIEQGDPTRFLYLGDVYENGTAQEFRTSYAPVYGPLRAITLPTPGNHEWANRDEGYYPYWARAIGARPPDHYSVRIAGWQILSLNSEEQHDARSAQLQWLALQLTDAGDCRIAFWHRPRYSAGTHGDQPDVDPLWHALAGHAVLVVNGHDHDMQELRVDQGIRELVAGAGGNARYPIDATDPRLAWGSDATDGALRLRLSPGRARYDFVAVDRTVLHSGVIRCRMGGG